MSQMKRGSAISWLKTHLGGAHNPAEHRALENAIANVSSFKDTDSPVFTLARLVEACDHILSGEAGALAEREKIETERLLPGQTPLNSMTIAAYVRLRRRLDERAGAKSEWTGPADATIRRTAILKDYVSARREAHLSTSAPRSHKAASVQEMIGRIEPIELRQEIRFILDRGVQARRELDLVKKGLANNGVDLTPLLDKTMGDKASPAEATVPSSVLSSEDNQHLAQIAEMLQDNEQLRQFELVNDGSRIKLSRPPATALLSKARLNALLHAIRIMTG